MHNDFLDWFSPGESKHPVFGKCVDKASLDIMVREANLPPPTQTPWPRPLLCLHPLTTPAPPQVKISKVKTRDDCPINPVKMVSVTVKM